MEMTEKIGKVLITIGLALICLSLPLFLIGWVFSLEIPWYIMTFKLLFGGGIFFVFTGFFLLVITTLFD